MKRTAFRNRLEVPTWGTSLVSRFTLATLLVAFTARAGACAVCMGSDNPQIVDASNSVLWALLGLVGFIFLATGLTALYLWRKSLTPTPPALELIPSIIGESKSDLS